MDGLYEQLQKAVKGAESAHFAVSKEGELPDFTQPLKTRNPVTRRHVRGLRETACKNREGRMWQSLRDIQNLVPPPQGTLHKVGTAAIPLCCRSTPRACALPQAGASELIGWSGSAT